MLTNNLNKSNLSRGVRNNNPLNLRITPIKWGGEINGNDNDFETFATTWQGVRAGVLDITNDISKGKNTIEKLINQFAPPTENNTKSYIDTVSKVVGISPTTKIKKDDYALFLKLIPAMIRVENGTSANAVTTEDILKGIQEAFKYRGYKIGAQDEKNIIPQKGTIISVFAGIALVLFLAKLLIK